MSHCRSPQTCSVCLGVPARRVDVVDGLVTVDGVVDRVAQPESALSQRNRTSAQRGADRRGRRR
jgi:hypothetical protein